MRICWLVQQKSWISSLPPKKPDEDDDRLDKLEDAFKNADGELGKVGVTKFLLWNEYRLSNPDGYSYPSSVNSTASERRRTAREK